MKEKRAVVFLPWIRLGEPVDVLTCQMLPLQWVLENSELNTEVKKQVASIVAEFRLRPEEDSSDPNCVVCTNTTDPFSLSNAGSFSELAQAVRVFAACSIAANDYLMHDHYINADCFEIQGQKFVVGEYDMAFSCRRRDGGTSDMGYGYNALRTTAPSWVRQCRSFNIDHRLLRALDDLRESKTSLYRRLVLSIDWLFLSFSDDPAMSVEMETLALASAFEQTHQSNMSPSMLSGYFSDFGSDAKTIAEWYTAFRKRRDILAHGKLKKRPDLAELQLDLFLGTEVLVALWKRILAENGSFELNEKDNQRVDQCLNVLEDNDVGSWGNVLDAMRRKAHRDLS